MLASQSVWHLCTLGVARWAWRRGGMILECFGAVGLVVGVVLWIVRYYESYRQQHHLFRSHFASRSWPCLVSRTADSIGSCAVSLERFTLHARSCVCLAGGLVPSRLSIWALHRWFAVGGVAFALRPLWRLLLECSHFTLCLPTASNLLPFARQ